MRRHFVLMLLAIFAFAALAHAQQPAKTAAAPPSKEDALLTAIRKSDAEAVKALIAQGVNVNHKFRYDRMALSFATDRGNMEIVKALVEAGADVNAKDSFYSATALDWTLQKENVEMARYLLEKGAAGREQALLGSAREGSVPMTKMLLALGGFKPQSLSEALDAAERAKKDEVVALLKEAGAKPLPKPDFVVDAATLEKYAGAYRSTTPGAPELKFTVKDGKLIGGVVGLQPPLTLGAFDAVRFAIIERSGIYITFKVEGGKCTGLHLKQGGFEADYTRVEEKQ